ncbi:FAD-dependent oxidoreductase, partial [Bacillus sp. HC-Mk]
LQKYKSYGTCPITGEIASQNIKLAEWESTWAGLRPQSNHEAPYMGEHEEIKGLYACTGHYRNGILLSPISGQYMADLIEGKQENHLLDSLLSRRV